MKISHNWLKEYVEHDWSPEEMSARLTLCGLEVEETEAFETMKGGLRGVVTGHVLTCEKHPNADKLRVTTVDVGGENPLHIVCGAPNVAAGQKVLVATVGTTVYPTSGGEITIQKAKIRGEVSEGMICAEDELGLGESHAGILVLDADTPVGKKAAEIFHVESDWVYTIGLTANRADAASHFGVARDVAALLRGKAKMPRISVKAEGDCPVQISSEDAERCPVYAGIYIRGVKVGPSPEWLQTRLKAIGARPVNNIVDVTNFVMHETGQPLHAFDAKTIRGNRIVVKTMADDMTFMTLDGQARNLRAGQDLMICDGEGPVAIAGVMGGMNSSVNENTTDIFLESAWFQPATVRKTAKRLGMSTDASYRFERGVDPNLALKAALRAADLMTQLAGGNCTRPSQVQLKDFPPFSVTLDLEKANRLMGRTFTAQEVKDILDALEIVTVSEKGNVLELAVPPYRVDVQRPQDVMEEIMRIFGMNNIPTVNENRFTSGQAYILPEWNLKRRLSERLAGAGWREIVVNSLISRKYENENTVNLLNNLSEEMAVLRPEMILPVLEVIEHNHNRRNTDLRLFENGRVFRKENGKYVEAEKLALYLTGKNQPLNWRSKQGESDLFTLVGTLDNLFRWMNVETGRAERESDGVMEYGVNFLHKGKVIGSAGEVSESLTKGRDIRGRVYYAVLDWKMLAAASLKQEVKYRDVPKFPAVSRDISMLVPDTLAYAEISKAIQACNPKLIRSVNISDIYKGDRIEAGRKSYLIHLTILDEEKTLTDEAADTLMERGVRPRAEKLGAVVRK